MAEQIRQPGNRTLATVGQPRRRYGAGRPGALTLNPYFSSTSVEPHHLGQFDATTTLTLTDTRDGPTLERAVKAFQGQPIHLPRRLKDQPGSAFLEERYGRFRAAG